MNKETMLSLLKKISINDIESAVAYYELEEYLRSNKQGFVKELTNWLFREDNGNVC